MSAAAVPEHFLRAVAKASIDQQCKGMCPPGGRVCVCVFYVPVAVNCYSCSSAAVAHTPCIVLY
jgi:hypothetical protein